MGGIRSGTRCWPPCVSVRCRERWHGLEAMPGHTLRECPFAHLSSPTFLSRSCSRLDVENAYTPVHGDVWRVGKC